MKRTLTIASLTGKNNFIDQTHLAPLSSDCASIEDANNKEYGSLIQE